VLAEKQKAPSFLHGKGNRVCVLLRDDDSDDG
jgi:hypothetical protein